MLATTMREICSFESASGLPPRTVPKVAPKFAPGICGSRSQNKPLSRSRLLTSWLPGDSLHRGRMTVKSWTKCAARGASKNYSCVKNETHFRSRSFRPKVQIGVRDPADNFRLERGPRRELENKLLVGALARWHHEVDGERAPVRVAAHEISCGQGFGSVADAGDPPSQPSLVL